MKKRGMTILEILVAASIFVMVITIAVGAFTSVSRMKALTSTMKDSQQKLRIAQEMISRYSRQAKQIQVINKNELITIYEKDAINFKTRFTIHDTDKTIYYQECTTLVCDWNALAKTDLMGGALELLPLNNTDYTQGSYFLKKGTIPPMLEFSIKGRINGSSTYYSDSFDINTTIILEGLDK